MSCLRLHFLSVLLLCCFFFASSVLMIDTLLLGLAACRPDQIQTLLQFKNEFDSRGCNRSEYFKGVRCDNTTGAVTKLQLPSGCLNGILKPNSSLFGLHQLRSLDLSHNNFTSSSLPSGFGNLNRLVVLSLSSNGFIGQVPSSISNLSLLTDLNISHNELIGSFPHVWNLTKLSFLDLSHNHFSGTIPSSLLSMPFLSYLELSENHFTGSVEVPNSTSSSRLDGQILEAVSKFITLKYLDLSFLNISYPIDLNLFSSLESLLNIDLSGTSISPVSLRSYLHFPLTMERLVLSDCDISEFPSFLKTLKNLELIDISHNKIKGKVPEWFWTLPHLIVVRLADNSLYGFEGSAEVLVNSSVQILSLASNQFKGPFPNPPRFINLLTARNNSFTGNIPLSTCNRSSFTLLILSYNNFTGPIPQCPSNFKIVKLRKNNLEGSIPDMFYVGASIQTLDFGYNQLTGKLPRSLLNCSFLQFLSVDKNIIKDTFPFWLKALPTLQVLTLSSNKFYGPISSSDQGHLVFPELRILDISHNNFGGSFPPSYFVNWKALSLKMNEDGSIYMVYNKEAYKNVYYIYEDVMDLQNKGLFMEQTKVLTSYGAIDFSGNRFVGKIPESIGLLKALIALNLSNNAFTGHIPLSLENLTELESLDLSRNQLSGTIPNGLKTLSFLAYINVSHNQLSGEIPQGTQITGQSKSSFEGNAGLCGLPLEQSCFRSSVPAIQPKQKDEEEEDKGEVLNWKAVAIGYGPGVLFGLAIAKLIASYKPEWLVKIIGPEKRKHR